MGRFAQQAISLIFLLTQGKCKKVLEPNEQVPTPIVDLSEFQGLGLIIKWPSGVCYSNQTSGLACHHPEIEGVFVPLFDGIGRPVLHAIANHFRGGWHFLAASDAKILERILAKHDLGFLTLDKSKLDTSFEAWVHVCIANDIRSIFGPRVVGFAGCNGILTWQNSD